MDQAEVISIAAIPVIAALIGWGTNAVAVKMIFRPRRPVRILGMTLQGVVPRRQRELAESIAETVESKLISHKDVQAVLQSPAVQQEIALLIDRELERFLSEKIKTAIPMAAMFLQGELLNQIKSLLSHQLQQSVPALLDSMLGRVEEKLNFRDIISEKVQSFDLSTLEEIIYRISARELKTVEVLGGVLGFLVGLMQVGVMLLLR